jgi:TonB-linked SusC/RagA family outer membrane protein
LLDYSNTKEIYLLTNLKIFIMRNISYVKVFYAKIKKDLQKTILIMKLTLLLTLLTLVNAAGSVYSQSKGLTLSMKNATLQEVFNKIEDQSKFKFFYQNEQIDVNRTVSVNVEGAKVEDVLDKLFANANIKYRVLEDNLVLLTADKLQQMKVSGTIASAKDGSPLAGVSVQEKGTTNGVISDVNGKYSLNVQGANSVLVFSFIGYLPEEKAVGSQTVINVSLSEDVKQLDEVVVIGYGSQKKTSITGAISSVSAKEISNLPVASLQSALQGQASGVSVVNYGTPGSDPVVRVRGVGSISYSADPLYVIDGVPATNMSSFDSQDIQSIEVLKDAASTAIYGSRAANGVILITTKKGKKDGKVHVSVDSYAGVQSIIKTLDVLNTNQYLQYGKSLITQATAADKTPVFPDRFNNMNVPIYTGATQTFAQTNTDWQGALFRNAMINDNNISISTGGEKSNFYASAGYFNQDGIMINTGYKRYSFRFNSDHQVSKRIRFGQTLLFSNGDKNNEKQQQGRTNIMHALREAPYLPVYNPNNPGGYQAAISGSDGQDAHNPIEIQNLFTSTTSTLKLFGTLYLEIKLADFLTFKTIAGLDYTNIGDKVVLPIFNDGFNSNSVATVTKDRTENITKTFTNQLTFDKSFGSHNLNIIAVQEETPFTSSYMFVTGTLPSNATTELTGLSNINANGNRQDNLLLSYLGRINYDFKNKYLLSASLRADGSSKFAPGNKWGYFKAGSLGWRLKEEDFLKNVDAISDLKLRVGYGEMGNNTGFGNYDWQSTISANTAYVFNNTAIGGTFFNALPNKQLKWETSKMTNVGVDLGLFGNKVTFSAEWFNKITDNLILAAQYDPSIGYYAPAYTNIGKMKNSGLELQAAVQINAGDFKSTLSGNISFIKNKVEALYANSPIDAGLNQDYGAFNFTRTAVGHPIQSFFGWKTNGIFQNAADVAKGPIQAPQSINPVTGLPDPSTGTAPGDIRFKDVNGDGKIDASDRQYLGSYLPISAYSFTYSGTYKRFDFSVFFQGVYGNKIYNGTKVITEGMLRLFNAGTAVLNAWTPSNTNTNIPRAVGGDPNQNVRTSDRFIESGSYLRLKNLSIGYTLPLSTLTKGNITQLRVYVSGQNLLTFTKYTGYDPEVGAYYPLGANNLPGTPGAGGTSTSGLLNNGVDYGLVPQPRTIMAGIQINF